jgi:hypothetical protein
MVNQLYLLETCMYGKSLLSRLDAFLKLSEYSFDFVRPVSGSNILVNETEFISAKRIYEM